MIKQIITTTTLIAAAATMANADVSLVANYAFDGNLNNSITDSDAWQNGGGVTVSYTDRDGGQSMSYTKASSVEAWNGLYLDTFKNQNITEWGIQFDVKFKTTLGRTHLLKIGGENTGDGGVGYQLCLGVSGNLGLSAVNSWDNRTMSSTSLVEGEWAKVSVTCVDNNVNVYLGAQKLDLSSVVAGNMAALTPNLSGLKLGYNNAAGNFRAPFGTEYDNFKVWTVGTTDSLASLETAMGIPEPSMFGLLAGLGALALVGARRRRK